MFEFDKLDSFSQIHGIAHRRGAPAIGATALTRQLILTCDHISYAAENDPSDKDHPKHMKNHVTFLSWQKRNLDMAFLQLAEDFRIPSPAIEKVNTHYQHFCIDGLFVKVILELYKDYLRVLFLVELEPPEDFDGYDPIQLVTDNTDMLSPSNLKSKLSKNLETITSEDSGDTATDDAHHFLRFEFWRQLDKILCIDTLDGLSECKMLLDLRGCMIASEDIVRDGFTKSAPTVGLFTDIDLAKVTAKALWRLASAGGRYANKEFVCCTLFRDSCVYVSSIASHIGPSQEAGESDETTFFVGSTPQGQRWQIGRLLYRINEIASYRLMAFKNHEEILNAGTEMNQIGSLIERLSGVEFKDVATLSKLSKLKRYKHEIDGLGSTNIAELGYKIERSQYFARRFRQAVETIDTGRVAGWQPYSDFIERRLQPTFDKITDVSTRFERLLKLYHAQLAELDTELQRQNTKDLVNIQTELLESSSFQHRIESIALAYYGGTILFTVTFGAFIYAPDNIPLHQYFGFEKAQKDIIEKVLKAVVFVISVLMAVSYFIVKEWQHHKKSHERKERLQELIGTPRKSNSASSQQKGPP